MGADMDGASRDRGRLARIAATLLTLALLAERAAGRSFPVRFLVLCILGRAEAVARAFVARTLMADGQWWDLPCLEAPSAMRGSAVDAELLALRLRMLAAILDALADAGDGLRDRSGDGSAFLSWGSVRHCSGGAPRLPALLIVRIPAQRVRRPYDTS